MRSICPNTNLDSWRSLVKSVGEDNAYRIWITSGFNIPENLSDKVLSNTLRTLTAQEAKAYIARTLPDYINIEDMSKLLYTIASDKQAFGAFKDSTIYLSEQAPYGTQFHEAFHAAFRAILTQPQIEQLRTVARSRMESKGGMAKWIADYQKQGYGLGKTGKELENIVIEEWLADEYSQYVSQTNQPKTFLERVWEVIKNIANYFAKQHDPIESIFYNLNTGQLKKYPKALNEFTESGNKVDTVFAQIDLGTKKLTQEDTMNLVSNVASTYITLSRVGVKDVSYKDIQDRLFETMDEITEQVDERYLSQAFDSTYDSIRKSYYTNGDSIIDRNALHAALKEMYFEGKDELLKAYAANPRYYENERRHNTLEQVLDLYKDRYNPMQPNISPELRRKLQNSYHHKVFGKEETRRQLTALVREHLDTIAGVSNKDDIDDLVEQDEIGHRNWEQNANETGGFDSASTYVKKYIATTNIAYTDEFGFDKLGTIQGQNGALDIDVTRSVIPNKIYYSLLKTLGGSQDTVKRLQKLAYFTKEADSNIEAKAFKEKFFKDFGIDETELAKGNLVMSATGEDQARFQKIMIAFSLYRKDMYRVLIDPRTGNTQVVHANQNNVGSIQIDKWAQRYADIESQKDFNIDSIRHSLGILALTLDAKPSAKNPAIDLLYKQAGAIRRISNKIGISVTPIFAEYSAAKINKIRSNETINTIYASAKKEKRQLREDESREVDQLKTNIVFYDSILNNYSLEENQYFSLELAAELNNIVNRPTNNNPFSATVERVDAQGNTDVVQDKIKFLLSDMAFGNANFDENVVEPTYKNAENKTIYTFQFPTFHLTEIAKLRDPEYLSRILHKGSDPTLNGIRDPNLIVGQTKDGKPVYLDSYDAEFLNDNLLTNSLLQVGQNLKAISLDGIANNSRDASGARSNTDQNTSFKNMSNADFTMAMLNMYAGNKFSYNVNGKKVAASPINLGILEASSTSDYVYLPDIQGLYNAQTRKLSSDAIDMVIKEIGREYKRIIRVNTELKNGTAVNKIEKYNTNPKDRGFKFSDSIRYYISPQLQEELENFNDPKFGTPEKWDQLMKYRRGIIADHIQAQFEKEKSNLIAKLIEDGLISRKNKREYRNILLDASWFAGTKNGKMVQDFDANISQYMMNEFLNGLAMGQILHGDPAMSYKNNGVDRVKRHKGDNAAISSIGFDYPVPELGIDTDFRYSNVLLIQDALVQNEKGEINTGDGQLYTTIGTLRKTLHGLGKLTPDVNRVLTKIEQGIKLSKEDLLTYDDEIKGQDYFTNSMKLVYKDGKRYLKMSVIPLTKELTSTLVDGVWMPRPGAEKLHDLRQRMEAEGKYQGLNRIDFTGFESASKQVAMDILKKTKPTESQVAERLGISVFDLSKERYEANSEPAYDYANAKSHLFDNNNFGLQLENPTNKLHITMPTQLIQIVENEQNEDLVVSFPNGKEMTMKEVKELYQKSFSSTVLNSFRIARQDIFKNTPQGQEYVALGNYVKRTAKNLAGSGADKQLLDLFGVDDNGNPKYDLNNNFSRVKYIQSILGHFSKGVLSQKVPGHTAALMSGYGYKLIKKAKVDKDGNLTGWDVVPRDSLEYNDAVRVFSGENQLVEHSPNVGDSLNDNLAKYRNYNGSYYFIDELRHNIPEYNESGVRTGYYSEYVLPPHLPRAIETNILYAATKYAQGVRIPSQDKHSGMNLKLVDYLPAHYGSTGMFAKEIIQLSGADFDIDKEYIITPDVYWDHSRREYVKYGSAKYATEKFDEMVGWYLDNNKEFSSLYKKTLKELNKNTTDRKVRLANKHKAMKQTLETFDMPSTAAALSDYTDKGGRELNNGKNHNEMLEAMIHMLQNDYNRVGISDQPATQDALVNVQNKSIDIAQPDHLIVLDSKGEPINGSVMDSQVFGRGDFYNTDSVMGKLTAHKNNSTGKDNIGIAVRSNQVGIFVHKHKIQLANKKFEYTIGGITYGGFDFADPSGRPGIYTKGEDSMRLFDAISAFISAATDEAKDQQNARYNLTQEKVSIGTTMILQGVHPKTAVMFVNQPIIAEFLKMKAGGSTSVKGYALAQTDGDILSRIIKKYADVNDEVLAPLAGRYRLTLPILEETLGQLYYDNTYSNTDLAEVLRYNKGDASLANREGMKEMEARVQIAVFMDYFKVITVAKDLKSVGDLMGLTKGLGTELEIVNTIARAKAALAVQADDEAFENAVAKGGVVLDTRKALAPDSGSRDKITGGNMDLATKLNSDFRKLFLEHTPLYYEMKDSFNKHLFSTRKDKVVENDLYAFLTLAAYKGFMQKTKNKRYDVSWDLIDPNKPNSIKDRYDRIKEMAETDPNLADNALIKHLLVYNTSKRKYNKETKTYKREATDVLQLSFDYISKIDTRNMQDIQEALTELAQHPNPEVAGFAASIFNYVILKEGMQYRPSGISKMIPVEFMQNYTRAISLLHKVTIANTEEEQGQMAVELFQRGYINKDDYTKMVDPKLKIAERKGFMYSAVFGKSRSKLIGDMLDTFASDIKTYTKLKAVEKARGDTFNEKDFKERSLPVYENQVAVLDAEGNQLRNNRLEFHGATAEGKSNTLFTKQRVLVTAPGKEKAVKTVYRMPFYFKKNGKVYKMTQISKLGDDGEFTPMIEVDIINYKNSLPIGIRAHYQEMEVHGSKELSYAGAAVTSKRYTPKKEELDSIKENEANQDALDTAKRQQREVDEAEEGKSEEQINGELLENGDMFEYFDDNNYDDVSNFFMDENDVPAEEPDVLSQTPIPVQSSIPIYNQTNNIKFDEEPTTGYRNRTVKNASADATIAIAVDFNTAGEKLTKSSVLQQQKRYIPIDVNSLVVTDMRVNKIVDELNSANAKTLNIAGNGIYTMKGKYTQEDVDNFTFELLNRVLSSSRLINKIESIRTGGQTGFDEAGAKAGQRLGISTLILAPKGWLFRDINGNDIANKELFISRFDINKLTVEEQQPESEEERLRRATEKFDDDLGVDDQDFSKDCKPRG